LAADGDFLHHLTIDTLPLLHRGLGVNTRLGVCEFWSWVLTSIASSVREQQLLISDSSSSEFVFRVSFVEKFLRCLSSCVLSSSNYAIVRSAAAWAYGSAVTLFISLSQPTTASAAGGVHQEQLSSVITNELNDFVSKLSTSASIGNNTSTSMMMDSNSPFGNSINIFKSNNNNVMRSDVIGSCLMAMIKRASDFIDKPILARIAVRAFICIQQGKTEKSSSAAGASVAHVQIMERGIWHDLFDEVGGSVVGVVQSDRESVIAAVSEFKSSLSNSAQWKDKISVATAMTVFARNKGLVDEER
jgi:hypothetical protein